MARNKPRRPDLRYGDRIGKLVFMGRVTLNSNARTPRYCSKFQCDCGGEIANSTYVQSDLTRRRDRWAKMPGGEDQNAMCGDCARQGIRRLAALHASRDIGAEDVGRELAFAAWNRLRSNTLAARSHYNDLVGVRRAKLSQIIDPLMFHYDRRWGHTRKGDDDPHTISMSAYGTSLLRSSGARDPADSEIVENGFEQFLLDMGMPPADKPMILRRDPYRGWYKHNCYWGSAMSRAETRVTLGQPVEGIVNVTVVNRDDAQVTAESSFAPLSIGFVPYSAVKGSRFDPYINPEAQRGACHPIYVTPDKNYPTLDGARLSLADKAPGPELSRGSVVQRIERVVTQSQSAQRTY